MTHNASLLWSFVRCVILASVAVWPVAVVVARIERSSSVRSRRLRLLLAVFPFFLPELLIGFNYRLSATQLTQGASPLTAAICTEALYSLLMLSRCLAVGVAVSILLPRGKANIESLHSWILLRTKVSSSTWWAGWLRLKAFGTWQAPLVAWSSMALVTFQEFETAALMQIDRYPVSWSVWLFDAHAARLPLLESLRIIIGPLLCELSILSPALCVLIFRSKTDDNDHVFYSGVSGRRPAWKSANFSALVTPGIVLFVLWPLVNNALPIMRGVLLMLQDARLGQSMLQILTSTGFSLGATVLSMGIATRICTGIREQPGDRRRSHVESDVSPSASSVPGIGARVFWSSLLLPGLFGPLVLSLGLLAVFQLPGFRGLYDTWLPMLFGQTLTVLPFAAVVVLLLQRTSDPAALHSAQLLTASEESRIRRRMATIRWRLTTGRWLLGGLIVAHRCFWDVTVTSILRPVQVEPVITRLYNEMHYGRTEALMSLSILAALTPLAIAAVAMLLSRLGTLLPNAHKVQSTIRK